LAFVGHLGDNPQSVSLLRGADGASCAGPNSGRIFAEMRPYGFRPSCRLFAELSRILEKEGATGLGGAMGALEIVDPDWQEQVDVVEVFLAAETVGEVVAWVDGGAHFAAVGQRKRK
jgi:hypothetical protein